MHEWYTGSTTVPGTVPGTTVRVQYCRLHQKPRTAIIQENIITGTIPGTVRITVLLVPAGSHNK